MASADEFTKTELLEMGEDEARTTLTVEQYEYWEKLNELHDEADETRERWAEEAEEVEDIVVRADREELGTRLDLFGNDVLIRVDIEDPDVKAAAEGLEDFRDEIEDHQAEELDPETTDELAARLLDLLDAVLLEWNGVDWPALPEDRRMGVLAEVRREWSVDGLLLAWLEIASEIQGERAEMLGVIESFRGEARR